MQLRLILSLPQRDEDGKMANIIVGIIVFAILGIALFSVIRWKQSGKTACGCECCKRCAGCSKPIVQFDGAPTPAQPCLV
jgi:hypothetical protein